MSLLRNALILVLAGSAAPALAEQITCESRQSGPEACGTIQPGSTVRLVRQLGDTPCVEGRNWGTGAAHDSLWVSQGCRAVFDVQAQPYDATASSSDSGYDRNADTRYDSDRPAQDDRSTGAQDDDPYAASRDQRLSQRNERAGAHADTARNDDQRDERDDRTEDRADDQGDRDESGTRDDREIAGARRDEQGDDRDADRQVAAAGRTHAVARQACIDEAAAGQSFGPDDVTATDVRWIGHGLLVVELQTPDGDLTCTVDRDGNVRSVDR